MSAFNPVMTRLNSDEQELRRLIANAPGAVQLLASHGKPPTSYTLRLHCRTVAGFVNNTPEMVPYSDVRIDLPEGYPLKRPTATVLTSFANPHIFPSGAICFGSAWTPGESLALFVTRIWRILVWDPLVLDPGSITNGPAMEWAKQHMTALPLDRTGPMEPPKSAPAPAAPKRSITWR